MVSNVDQPASNRIDQAKSEIPTTAAVTKTSHRENTKKSSTGGRQLSQVQNPDAAMIASTLAKVESKTDATRAALTGNQESATATEKPEKKKKKRAGTAAATEFTPRSAEDQAANATTSTS